jgi:hypothetical protein
MTSRVTGKHLYEVFQKLNKKAKVGKVSLRSANSLFIYCTIIVPYAG